MECFDGGLELDDDIAMAVFSPTCASYFRVVQVYSVLYSVQCNSFTLLSHVRSACSI